MIRKLASGKHCRLFIDMCPRFRYIRTSPLSDAAWEAFPDRAGESSPRGRAS